MTGAKFNLFVFTNEYPYGTGESFIENELIVLSEQFDTIFILPLYKNDKQRKFPIENVRLVNLFEDKVVSNKQILWKNYLHFFSIIGREFVRSKTKKYFFLRIRKLISILLKNFAKEEVLNKFILNSAVSGLLYYSFWTDDWATILSISKEKGHINSFFSRVHGYDLYQDRWPDKMIPFRHFQLKNVCAIYAASKDGQTYLKRHYPEYSEKFRLSHLGTFDNGQGYFDPHELFTIVSCSRLDRLKRVHLIAEAIQQVTFPMRWIHFGDGEEMGLIKRLCAVLPDNVKVELKGNISNDQLMNFYKTTSVNLFINTSKTEGGVPLALQEAASFGIPLVGTATGGVVEIVNEKTGILLPVECTSEELRLVITDFRSSDKNIISFRIGVRSFWKDSFNARMNYMNFYESIIK